MCWDLEPRDHQFRLGYLDQLEKGGCPRHAEVMKEAGKTGKRKKEHCEMRVQTHTRHESTHANAHPHSHTPDTTQPRPQPPRRKGEKDSGYYVCNSFAASRSHHLRLVYTFQFRSPRCNSTYPLSGTSPPCSSWTTNTVVRRVYVSVCECGVSSWPHHGCTTVRQTVRVIQSTQRDR